MVTNPNTSAIINESLIRALKLMCVKYDNKNRIAIARCSRFNITQIYSTLASY